jgi:hypothetical protein
MIMLSIFRSSIGSWAIAISLGAVTGMVLLTTQLTSPQSLADYITAICANSFRSASAAEASYLTENIGVMTKMMLDMRINPTGDVDTDFVAMMVPHHRAAIEMAQAELRYGHNESLRRMAQEIVVTQLQEIAAMQLAVGQPLPPSVASLDQTAIAATNDLGPSSATHPVKGAVTWSAVR